MQKSSRGSRKESAEREPQGGGSIFANSFILAPLWFISLPAGGGTPRRKQMKKII